MPAYCDQKEAVCRDTLAKYSPDVTGVLRIDSPSRAVIIKDLKIRVNGDFTDAVVLRQNPNVFAAKEFDGFQGIDVFIRNFGAYDIGGAGAGLHGDIVQLQNGIYRNMFFENIDGTTGYQGFSARSPAWHAEPVLQEHGTETGQFDCDLGGRKVLLTDHCERDVFLRERRLAPHRPRLVRALSAALPGLTPKTSTQNPLPQATRRSSRTSRSSRIRGPVSATSSATM